MLSIGNIDKHFGSQTALKGFNLEVQDGEFISLLGPSGCGKTTLLNIIAGFEQPDGGTVTWRGKSLAGLPARERPFHMVFQGYALFPHLNVFENVAFALRLQKKPNAEVTSRVKETLELVGLNGFETRSVETLSGGQQQRVAVARALAPRPEIVLLDEPLSALDRQLRAKMQAELRLLQKRLKLTFILVTHDQEEALSVSDRVALLHQGGLEQVGTPEEIYLHPKTSFVASFVGARNLFTGEFVGSRDGKGLVRLKGLVEIQGELMDSRLTSQTSPQAQGFICPEHVALCSSGSGSSGRNQLRGRVIETLFRGEAKEAFVETESGVAIRLRLEQSQNVRADENVVIELAPESVHLFLKSDA